MTESLTPRTPFAPHPLIAFPDAAQGHHTRPGSDQVVVFHRGERRAYDRPEDLHLEILDAYRDVLNARQDKAVATALAAERAVQAATRALRRKAADDRRDQLAQGLIWAGLVAVLILASTL